MAALKEMNQDRHGIAIDDCWNRIGVWGGEKPRCKELDKVIHCVNCKVYSGAGRLLLDRAADQDYIANWSEQLKKEKKKKHENMVSVVVFRIADEWLGLSARLFQEVGEMRVVHRVPHSKTKVLRGLINIRGELHLCVSMGQLLGIEKRGKQGNNPHVGMGARMVVVANDTDRYVFPVTEVQGIHRYAPSDLQAVPTTAGQSKSNYLSGVFELNDKHIGQLDEGLVFSSLRRILG